MQQFSKPEYGVSILAELFELDDGDVDEVLRNLPLAKRNLLKKAIPRENATSRGRLQGAASTSTSAAGAAGGSFAPLLIAMSPFLVVDFAVQARGFCSYQSCVLCGPNSPEKHMMWESR